MTFNSFYATIIFTKISLLLGYLFLIRLLLGEFMANIARTYLTDKDIRNLTPKEKKYFKVVGNPKEIVRICQSKRHKNFYDKIKTRWQFKFL